MDSSSPLVLQGEYCTNVPFFCYSGCSRRMVGIGEDGEIPQVR